MNTDWKDIWARTGKTFVQAFFGILIPQICIILEAGFPENWPMWWAYLSPILSSALAGGLCAAWNYLLQYFEEKHALPAENVEIFDVEEK